MNKTEKALMRDFNIPEVVEFEFNKGCMDWTNDFDENLWTVRMVFATLNDERRRNGYVLLKDIYDLFYIPEKDRQAYETIVGSFGDVKHTEAPAKDGVSVLITVELEGLIIYKLLVKKGEL